MEPLSLTLDGVHLYEHGQAATLKWSTNYILLNPALDEIIVGDFEGCENILPDYLYVSTDDSRVPVVSYEWQLTVCEAGTHTADGTDAPGAGLRQKSEQSSTVEKRMRTVDPVDPSGLKGRLKSIKILYHNPAKVHSAKFRVEILCSTVTWRRYYILALPTLPARSQTLTEVLEVEQNTDFDWEKCVVTVKGLGDSSDNQISCCQGEASRIIIGHHHVAIEAHRAFYINKSKKVEWALKFDLNGQYSVPRPGLEIQILVAGFFVGSFTPVFDEDQQSAVVDGVMIDHAISVDTASDGSKQFRYLGNSLGEAHPTVNICYPKDVAFELSTGYSSGEESSHEQPALDPTCKRLKLSTDRVCSLRN